MPEHAMPEGGELEELSFDECLILLRAATLGRIAMVVDGVGVQLLHMTVMKTDERL